MVKINIAALTALMRLALPGMIKRTRGKNYERGADCRKKRNSDLKAWHSIQSYGCCNFCRQEQKMAVSWNKDIDTALAQAKTQHKPVLVDFSAAPA